MHKVSPAAKMRHFSNLIVELSFMRIQDRLFTFFSNFDPTY